MLIILAVFCFIVLFGFTMLSFYWAYQSASVLWFSVGAVYLLLTIVVVGGILEKL